MRDLLELAAERAALLRFRREFHALLRMKSEIVLLRGLLKFRRFLCDYKAGFRPDQPRWPAGSGRISGRWSGGARTGGPIAAARSIRIAHIDNTLTDAFGEPYYQRGGHHEMAKGVHKNWNLRPETKKVFDDATTGKVPRILLRTTPEGVPQGHFWNGPGGAHFQYNEAVRELADRFLRRNNLVPEQLTPDHARALLREIRESADPRIRDYNNMIRLLRRLYRIRPGRGHE